MKLTTFIVCALFAGPLVLVGESGVSKLTPEEEARFKEAAKYSDAARGLSLLVMRDGEIVFEDYAPIWNSDKPHLLGTGTMSFVGVLAACAAHDGLLGFDERASDTLVEWKNSGNKERVTIRQLLGMTSGIEGHSAVNALPTYRAAVMLAEAVAAPGERFSLGPVPVQCFGELLRRKLAPQNLAVGDYLERRLLAPIGLRVGFWRRDSDNEPILYSGAFLTAREWAKFGELVRNRGRWKGQQIVREDLLAQCLTAPAVSPAFALGWWLLAVDEGGAAALIEGRRADRVAQEIEARKRFDFTPPPDAFAAMGKGKQRCYVIPSRDLVVIRAGDSDRREFLDCEFLEKLLGPGAPAGR